MHEISFYLNKQKTDFLKHLSAFGYDDGEFWAILSACRCILNSLNDGESFDYATEYDVLAIQEIAGSTSYEKLTSIGVGARVCHRHDTGTRVIHHEAFIREFVTINRN